MVVLTNGSQLGCEGSFCFYCGRPVRAWKYKMYATPPADARTADHVTPACKGGTETVTACKECNADKYHLNLDEYRLLVAYRAGKIGLPEYKFAAERLPA